MLSFWSNCKIGVKLQAAFALVMLIFVAALVGVSFLNQKVAAAQNLQDTQLVPSRSNIKDVEIDINSARADGWFYIATADRAEGLRHLGKYRADLVDLRAKIN